MTSTSQRQTVAVITRAQGAALMRKGGIVAPTAVVFTLSVLAGLIVLFVLLVADPGASHVLITTPVEATAFVHSLGFGLIVAVAVGRDPDGASAFAMLRSPRRGSLYVARAASLTLASMASAVVATGCVALIAIAIRGVHDPSWAALVGLGVLVSSGGSGALAAIACGVAVLMRRSVAAVLVYLALLIVLPLVVAIGAGVMPPAVAGLLGRMSGWTPTLLASQLFGVSALPTLGVAPMALATVGLTVWVLVLNLCALRLFVRRDVE